MQMATRLWNHSVLIVTDLLQVMKISSKFFRSWIVTPKIDIIYMLLPKRMKYDHDSTLSQGTAIPQCFITSISIPFSRSSSKAEEACDMYTRAANMFKMAKNWNGMSATT